MRSRSRTTAQGDRPPSRVVLDTNVVLSALVFGRGKTSQLRSAWQAARFVPLVSSATTQELLRVLAYPKFKLDAEDQRELLADYLPYADAVRIPQPPPAVPPCRDPFDAPFLHLAVAGRADALVTGDADLLTLSHVGPCVIATPRDFLSRLTLPSVAMDTVRRARRHANLTEDEAVAIGIEQVKKVRRKS